MSNEMDMNFLDKLNIAQIAKSKAFIFLGWQKLEGEGIGSKGLMLCILLIFSIVLLRENFEDLNSFYEYCLFTNMVLSLFVLSYWSVLIPFTFIVLFIEELHVFYLRLKLEKYRHVESCKIINFSFQLSIIIFLLFALFLFGIIEVKLIYALYVKWVDNTGFHFFIMVTYNLFLLVTSFYFDNAFFRNPYSEYFEELRKIKKLLGCSYYRATYAIFYNKDINSAAAELARDNPRISNTPSDLSKYMICLKLNEACYYNDLNIKKYKFEKNYYGTSEYLLLRKFLSEYERLSLNPGQRLINFKTAIDSIDEI